ncbi:sugar ABC transporter substrate-binding protein [Desulforamulus hydrothermalis]|uniref:Monosaccharide ABC transporter substrate-binding protein, CUT2 family n=1 Tax=Desulforamulus hydrothermalis Lam5 = DSM 18033 TaxID=1121428 RepID=K8EF04_9FIRM|nr:substrate-binding domain-containing protein [Desulforamulus hydrothermalis]CCO07306.1 Monosaccharide ABC transporter substrate-binding protein, CUT2 family [Desulforamulus hydrothermalis Lam5 = DSM 18033]SHG93669.1 monosaccharide ABC transporter substrate-binding protein, CUT2 family [Desulforamulus hydrothermalis Lam5 = DSM 18033]
MKQPFGMGILITFVLLSCTLLTGCPGPEAQPKPEAGQNISIGVSLVSMEFDGNRSIKTFMQERSKKEKVQLVFTDAKNDPAQQEKDVDKLIKQKVKAIILQTADPLAGAQLADKIMQANIKVVGLETLPFNAPLDGYVASDHVRAGEMAGQFVLNQLNTQNQSGGQQQGGQGQSGSGGQQNSQSESNQQSAAPAKNKARVLILQGDPSDKPSQLIATAAQQVLQQSKQVAEIKVVEHPQGDAAMAQMTVLNALKSGTPDAILATNGPMAQAAVSVLRSEGLDNKVITVGVGADRQNSQALAAGQHDAEIDIMPEMLANFALAAALDLAEKGAWNNDSRVQNGNFDIPAKIVPVRLIDKNQVHLLEARWGKLKKQQQQQGQQDSQQASPGGQQSSSGQSSGSSGQEGQQEKKTKLKIVTQDGKVMEVEVKGEIQKIEQSDSGGKQENQSSQQGGSQGGP